MALNKSDHQLEQVVFVFDDAGEVKDVQACVNYAVEDDVTGDRLTRMRQVVTVWNDLPPTVTQAAANDLGKRIRELVLQV